MIKTFQPSATRAAAVFLSVFVLLLAFQNCGVVKSFVSDNSENGDGPAKSGNGYGYDGKPFVRYGDCGELKSVVTSRIYVARDVSKAFVTRENCEELITPKELTSSQFRLSSDMTQLTLFSSGSSGAGEVTFVTEGSKSASPSPVSTPAPTPNEVYPMDDLTTPTNGYDCVSPNSGRAHITLALLSGSQPMGQMRFRFSFRSANEQHTPVTNRLITATEVNAVLSMLIDNLGDAPAADYYKVELVKNTARPSTLSLFVSGTSTQVSLICAQRGEVP